MANTKFQLKRSVVPGKIPQSADLEIGEIALNLSDQRGYTKHSTGNVIVLFDYLEANSAYLISNLAYNQSNTANINAVNAYSQATLAYNFANTRYSSSGGTISGDVAITGNVGIGTISSSYKLDINGTAKANSLILTANTASTNTTTGTLIVTGGVGISGALNATTKSFDIKHPSDPNKRLTYGSLESPFHGVRLTGKGTVCKGNGIVRLPDYFKDLVRKEEINIQLTNIRHGEILWVVEERIEENYFVVGSNSEKELEFYWSLTAERADVEKLIVEY